MYEHGGDVPKCACGCGQEVAWRGNKFNRLVLGHYTDEMKKAVSGWRTGSKLSDEDREKFSKSRKEYFSSEKGKQVAADRAQKLREFHRTEEGEKWRRDQSARMKSLHASEEGKDTWRHVAEDLRVLYSSEQGTELRQRIGRSVKEYFSSDVGREFLSERSRKMSEFYKTDEGQATIASMSEKISIKNRLPIEEVLRRLESISDQFDVISNVEEDYKLKTKTAIVVKCKKCESVWMRTLQKIEDTPTCFTCEPPQCISLGQRQLYEYVLMRSPDAVLDDRSVISPLEIDVVVPSSKLGIEFNGLYWHSEKEQKDRHYHTKKSNMAAAAGYRLFHIFQDEWRDKRAIIESMLTSRLGLSERVSARNCTVEKIDHDTREKFFEMNHIDGDVRSSMCLGLVEKQSGQLVQAMSFRKPHHRRYRDRMEIARCCSLLGHTVVGGISRLISNGLRLFPGTQIMTYVDTRFGSRGESYIKSGLRVESVTKERFWWTDCTHRYDRFSCRAQSGVSENDVARSRGLTRIWTCPNVVLVTG